MVSLTALHKKSYMYQEQIYSVGKALCLILIPLKLICNIEV